ncbi:aminodeoxychorismate lyase [Paenibacillus septentrionalis]|uniref:Aminodeoxychorismate lyase n=2 Tax=Paenibacillus septentrionalis TaxID=429342 RepID=A0ABW1VC82_9BACL
MSDMRTLYVNGKLMNAKEAMVSVYDHGFLYGLGLFETFRTYHGRCFLLERHINRLLDSCRQLGIACELTTESVQQIVTELLERNQLEEGYVRLTVSGGVGDLGLPMDDYSNPTIVVMVKPLAVMSADAWKKGKALQLLRTRRNSPEGAYRFKSLHYMNNIIAKRELLQLGDRTVAGAEGLMVNEKEQLAEGIVSNLFFVKDNVVHTPHIDTGILPGITRQFVIELAKQHGYDVKEGHYTFAELWTCSEAWITNSIQELVPVTTLLDMDGSRQTLSQAEAGSICTQLAQAYLAAAMK